MGKLPLGAGTQLDGNKLATNKFRLEIKLFHLTLFFELLDKMVEQSSQQINKLRNMLKFSLKISNFFLVLSLLQ